MADPVTTDYTFDEGIDPTATWGIYASVLLQLIRQATPNSYRGLVIYDSATPTVTGAYAWQKRCLWINTSDWQIYKYNTGTSSWEPVTSTIAAGSITDTMLAGSISISKLSVGIGNANKVLQVNVGGTALQFSAVSSLIAAGSISQSQVAAGPLGASYCWVSDGGVNGWALISDLPGYFYSNSVPIGTLVGPGAGTTERHLTADTSGVIGWRTFSYTIPDDSITYLKLASTGGTAGQVLTVVGSDVLWATPTVPPVSKEVASTSIAIPAGGAKATVSITALSGMPKRMQLLLRCISADGEFSNGDIVDCSTAVQNSVTGDHAFCLVATGTNAYIIAQAGSLNIAVYKPSDGTTYNITAAKWVLDFYAWA